MEEIKNLNIRVHNYLEEIGFEKLIKVHSTNNRYRIMTMNVAESMNAVIKSTRELPITTLLEYL